MIEKQSSTGQLSPPPDAHDSDIVGAGLFYSGSHT